MRRIRIRSTERKRNTYNIMKRQALKGGRQNRLQNAEGISKECQCFSFLFLFCLLKGSSDCLTNIIKLKLRNSPNLIYQMYFIMCLRRIH